ncbi:hypothetical protein O6H91_10G070300 [Diphasiastrum complanatum]|uniref:Uncharacterized protein n=1 Tax=Diphasiastrum complanatum TaxID=34168 RepID=A0ACC2CI67_DIPCM|nr:hypothetical protein O6H91_Y552200 [Diphasiastrum complanatum]KAJ7541677.1 hypothetical protein O6H91_10G070300 [Diphasiastrum complanatum]
MGNCQATDAAAAVVEHPGGRTERLYWPISARQLMLKNPGHYVAVYAWPTSFSDGTVKPKLKLLPPTAMLSVGNCYRILSFEEVLGEVSETTNGKLLKFRKFKSDSKARFCLKKSQKDKESNAVKDATLPVGIDMFSTAQSTNKYGQWRPSLHSISEMEW